MKKNRILKFALIGIVIVALGFMGLNLIQAQVKTLVKPVKEPSYTWSLRVLPETSSNIIGMTDSDPSDHIYEDGVLNTTIYYEKHYIRELKGTQTDFLIFISTPDPDEPKEWVEFQNVGDSISDITYYPEDGEPLLDLYTFLNLKHPLPEYDNIMFRLAFFEDLENFNSEAEVQWEGLAFIEIVFWNESYWEDKPDDDAHTLTARAYDNLDEFYITRAGADTWKFSISQQPFELKEQYYCEVQGEPIGNSGKYKTVTKLLYPQTATAKLSFVFELTREKI